MQVDVHQERSAIGFFQNLMVKTVVKKDNKKATEFVTKQVPTQNKKNNNTNKKQ